MTYLEMETTRCHALDFEPTPTIAHEPRNE